jgi:hypothetical protein
VTPRRESTQQRRKPTRVARQRVLIVCGSERTEVQYLRGLRDSRGNRAVDVTVRPRPKAPIQVVEYARTFADRAGTDFDEIWCVFDVDEFDVEPAYLLAGRDAIQLAVSRPCFEFWLLLHHIDCRQPGMTPAQALRSLAQHVPGFAKNSVRFTDFATGVGTATKRARELGNHTTFPPGDPSSGMGYLVETVFEPTSQEPR